MVEEKPLGMRSYNVQSRDKTGQFLGYLWNRGTDDKGHRSQIKFNCPPQVVEIVDELVAMKKFPFATRSSLFRYLAYSNESLEDLVTQSQEPRAITLWGQVRNIERLLSEQIEQAKFSENISTLRSVLTMVNDDPSYASERVREVYGEAKKIPDHYWRAKYTKMIETEFGHYLRKDNATK